MHVVISLLLVRWVVLQLEHATWLIAQLAAWHVDWHVVDNIAGDVAGNIGCLVVGYEDWHVA